MNAELEERVAVLEAEIDELKSTLSGYERESITLQLLEQQGFDWQMTQTLPPNICYTVKE